MVAKTSSRKLKTELFDDLPVLQRKWQAAVRPGEKLPRYEDVMLGSLGRIADHIVLLKQDQGALAVSRTGRYVQKWLNDERWDIPLSELSPDCATVLHEAAASALSNNRPHLALAHCVRDGMVKTYDVLAMPTASRWGGTLVGTYVNEQGAQYNLLDAVFANTEDGVLSLATLRDGTQKPFDFQIVHHNRAAAALLKVPAESLQWRRLSEGGNLLCASEVAERLLEVVATGRRDQFEMVSDSMSPKAVAPSLRSRSSLSISN